MMMMMIVLTILQNYKTFEHLILILIIQFHCPYKYGTLLLTSIARNTSVQYMYNTLYNTETDYIDYINNVSYIHHNINAKWEAYALFYND